MKKFLALVLSAVLLVSVLAACGGDKKAASGDGIVGKWNASVDMTDYINQTLEAGGMGEFVQLSDFEMVMVMELKSDNTYTLTVDKDALADSMEGVKDQMKDGLGEYFAQMMPGVDFEQALAQSGMSMDDMLDQSMDLDAMSGSLNLAGQYKAEDGKLYMSNDTGVEPTENYLTYDLSGDTLKLDAGNATPEASLSALLPFNFERVG